MSDKLIAQAAALLDDDPDAANSLCIQVLDSDPDNAKALFLMATVLLRAEKFGMSYNLLKRVIELAPKQAGAWNNLGMALEGMQMYDDARRAFSKAASLDKNPDYQSNIAMVAMHEGDYEAAKRVSSELLKKYPDHTSSLIVNGFASLATGDWKAGWAGYEHTLGGKFRKEFCYGNEPRWDGSKTKNLVVYGEQGLGDEIMFASCIPDINNADNILIDCDHRLEGLFKRSFPHCQVHGTRRADGVEWLAGYEPTARVALGSLPGFYRNQASDFPKQAFLKADPERALMWRSLFDSWKKPVIGIAWSGGRRHTGASRREVGLEAFRGLIETGDAIFVSLQYRNPRKEIEASGLAVRHFSASESQDYDDLAAMVSELDMVIGVHTAALHLAGGLGVETIGLVPNKPSWAYNTGRMLWYPHYTIHKQKAGEKWADCVKRISL